MELITLLKKRDLLSKKLSSFGVEILRGSLIKRYKPCGKSGCKCANGLGHGPKHYLSVSQKKARPRMDYVPQKVTDQVKNYLENYQQLKAIIEEICLINLELLKRRHDI